MRDLCANFDIIIKIFSIQPISFDALVVLE